MVIYICTKFHEIFWTVFKLKSGHGFHMKNFKGHNSVEKNGGGVTVLILCTSSDRGLYLYKVS